MSANASEKSISPKVESSKLAAPGKKPVVSTIPEPSFPVGLLLIAAAAFVAFWPTLKNGFVWDDPALLFENPFVTGKDGLFAIWFSAEHADYYPMTLSSLWFEWQLWGMKNPGGYHFTNLFLHIGGTIFLWRSLRYLNIPGAWWAALLFAVHPVNVESVAWIAERKNTLAFFFYGLALVSFLRFDNQASSTSRGWYYFSIAMFVLGLLSKTAIVMMPFVLLGCAWWQRGRITRADILRTIPFFGASLVLGLVTIWFQYQHAIGTQTVLTNDFRTRLAGAGWVVWFYLYKALLPLKLMFVYPRWNIDPQKFVSYLPGVSYLALAGIFGWLAYRGKSWARPFFFALAYFAVTLFPVLGFFKIYFFRYSLVADHYQYFSMIGIVALVVGILAHVLKRQAVFAFVILAVALSAGTWKQSRIYKNQQTLWADTMAKNPATTSMAHINLGDELDKLGRADEALEHYRAAVAADPNDDGAHYSVGYVLLEKNQTVEAIREFREALRCNPNHLNSLSTLGWLLATSRDRRIQNGEDAVRFAARAVEITREKDIWKLDILGAAYAANGQFEQAVKTQEQAIALAKATGHGDAVAELESRLPLYQAKRPYRPE